MIAYRLGVFFRLVSWSVVLLVVAGGVGLVLKSKDAISAFGDRLENPTSRTDGDEDKLDQIKAKRKICSTLDDATRQDLIGRATPVKLLNVEGSLDPYTCRWAPRRYQTVTAFVEVIVVPANTWALEVRSSLALMSMDQRLKTRLLGLLRKPKVTAADGCRFARALFEAGGGPRGAERTVTRSTVAGSTPSMTAQSCVGGTYYAVLVTAPGLRLDDSLLNKMTAALRTVERRLA